MCLFAHLDDCLYVYVCAVWLSMCPSSAYSWCVQLLLRGHLWKKKMNRVASRWKWRFVVLYGCHIHYATSDKDPPLGSLYLSDARVAAKGKESRKHTFTLALPRCASNSGGKYLFACDEESKRDEWVKAIQVSVNRVQEAKEEIRECRRSLSAGRLPPVRGVRSLVYTHTHTHMHTCTHTHTLSLWHSFPSGTLTTHGSAWDCCRIYHTVVCCSFSFSWWRNVHR
jgi:PH domain